MKLLFGKHQIRLHIRVNGVLRAQRAAKAWGGGEEPHAGKRADADGEHLKGHGSDGRNSRTKRNSTLLPTNLSFLINFETLVGSEPCLNTVSESRVQERPQNPPNCPLLEYASALCWELEVA